MDQAKNSFFVGSLKTDSSVYNNESDKFIIYYPNEESPF